MRTIPLTAAATVIVWALTGAPAGAAGPVRSRIAVLVDSSGPMLLTPQSVTLPGNCTTAGMNGCTFNGNPSAAQETCNACVISTIGLIAPCATLWNATCQSQYALCIQALTGSTTCSQNLSLKGGLSTRGDGSGDLPGCDVDGNGLPDDSGLFQVKRALAAEFTARSDVEFALWRHAQIEGGQSCTTDAQCPATPGGLHVLACEAVGGAGNVCAFDADLLDGPTTSGFEGQCNRLTFTGSPATFTCAACDAAISFDRASCMAWNLDRVRTGASSPLNLTTVGCFPTANPQHRFMKYHGAVRNGSLCDPAGAQRLVDYPPTGLDDNVGNLLEWIDNDQTPFGTASELRAEGVRPIAASLRDMRTALQATLAADLESACRPYRAVLITSGTEECETVAAARTAATALLSLNVPLYVIAVGDCPSGAPGCTASGDLNSIAAAGGTGAAYFVVNEAELRTALDLISDASVLHEVCNGLDDDCNGVADDGFAVPSSVSMVFVESSPGPSQVSWPAVTPATGYDVVVGSLSILRSTGGNFTAATSACLANDATATGVVDSTLPGPNDGLWYLVRAVNCHVPGTYESGDASQQGARDPEIAASPNACP